MTWIFATTQDRQAFYDAIAEIRATSSDRAAGIVAASFLENQLTTAIQNRMHPHDKIIPKLFRPSGPLGNFGTKIDLGFSMGIYSEELHRELTTIKKIRNEFAHKMEIHTFDAQSIAALTCKLKMIEKISVNFDLVSRRGDSETTHDKPRLTLFPRGGESDPISTRERYILSCQVFIGLLAMLPCPLEGRTLRPIISFLLGTGARRGEALALRWKDVDLGKSIVRIERSVEQTKGSLRFKAPKTKNGRRNVSISPWLVAELRAHRAKQQERRLSLGQGKAPDDALVFARWDGKTRAPHWLTQKFAHTMATLKIDCTLHGLRHTHVSQLIAAGLDVLTISRRIGHASAAITLDVYGHMFKNTDTRAAEIMEAAFARVRTE